MAIARVLQPRYILVAAWAIGIAYSFPGFMNFDAADQLWQARSSPRAPLINDWHPPLMSSYWYVLEIFVRGPFLMLVLQTTLFVWGLYEALRIKLRARAAAIVTVVVYLFPPVFTPMAPVWKDAQMAGFLLAGTMLALRSSTWRRVLGCVLLVFAVGVRDNGAAALPPLLLVVTSRWFTRRLVTVLAAAALFVAITVAAFGANRLLTQEKLYPWFLSTAIHDIAGTICHEGPMTDREVLDVVGQVVVRPASDLQRQICERYRPRVWFSLVFTDTPVFEHPPFPSDREARRDAWWRAIELHPRAFLAHRWAVSRQILGLVPDQPWEPVCTTFAGTQGQLSQLFHLASLSWFQKKLTRSYVKLGPTLLYRPWVYAVISLVLIGYALVRRSGYIAAVLASGLLYELSLCAFAAAPDFRYSHWMVTCTCIGIVLVFTERWRAGRATSRP